MRNGLAELFDIPEQMSAGLLGDTDPFTKGLLDFFGDSCVSGGIGEKFLAILPNVCTVKLMLGGCDPAMGRGLTAILYR